MQAFVTGAAGFIGSSLADRLLERGDRVIGYDNFSTGQRRFIEAALGSDRFTLVEATSAYKAPVFRGRSCQTVFYRGRSYRVVADRGRSYRNHLQEFASSWPPGTDL